MTRADEIPSSAGVSIGARRVQWVDAARAVCVLAITLMHFQLWVMNPNVGDAVDVQMWRLIVDNVNQFSLSLLFILSGVLGSGRIRAGWSDRRNLVSAANFYYLYVLWLVIYWVVTQAFVSPTPMGVQTLDSLLPQLALPHTVVWFVLALAVYTLLFSGFPRLSPAVVLPILAALSLSVPFLPGEEGNDLYLRVAYFAFHFGLGVYFGPSILTLSRGPMTLKATISVAAYVGIRWVGSLLGAQPFTDGLVRIATELSASVAAIAVVVLVCQKLPALGKGMAALGRLTLPIFVIQMPVIWGFMAFQGWGAAFNSPVLRLFMPILGIATISGIALMAHWLLIRSPARFVFEMPRSFALLIGRRPSS